jgi:hypothetical protein
VLLSTLRGLRLPETHASAVAAAAVSVTATATVTCSSSSSSHSASAMDVDVVVEQQQQVQVEAVISNGVLQENEVAVEDTDESSSNAQQGTFNSGNGPLTSEQLDPLVSVLQLYLLKVYAIAVFVRTRHCIPTSSDWCFSSGCSMLLRARGLCTRSSNSLY